MKDGKTINPIKEKVKYYFKNQIKVHIKKKNGWFNNGRIIEFTGDLLILEDRVLGSIPIYLIEILEIEKAKEDKENET